MSEALDNFKARAKPGAVAVLVRTAYHFFVDAPGDDPDAMQRDPVGETIQNSFVGCGVKFSESRDGYRMQNLDDNPDSIMNASFTLEQVTPTTRGFRFSAAAGECSEAGRFSWEYYWRENYQSRVINEKKPLDNPVGT